MAAAIRAGKAMVKVYADNSALMRSLDQSQKRLRAFSVSVGQIGMGMAKVAAVIAAPLALSARVFAGFSDQMAQVRAVTGATADQFRAMAEEAKRLGRTTSFTSAQVASGMTELGRAGFKSEQILAGISPVLNLARGTATEFGQAANIAAAAMRGFGLEAEDMEHVTDVLVFTANNSAQTLEELGESMKYVAPMASEAGETIEDVSAALAILANNGIKGTMAGTALGRAYKNLSSDKAQSTLSSLGVAAADTAGDLRPIVDIIADIGQATAQMGTRQRLAIFEQLFGRAAKGALKLKAGEGFKNIRNALDDVAGTAKRTADIMDDTLGGSWRMMKSAAEGTAIAIGKAIGPTLREWMETAVEIAGTITVFIKQHKELISKILKTTVVIGGMGLALIVLGKVALLASSAMVTLKVVMGGVVTATKALSVAMTFMAAHPLGAIITLIGVIASLALGLGYLHRKSIAAKNAEDKVARAMKTAEKAAGHEKKAVKALGDEYEKLGKTVKAVSYVFERAGDPERLTGLAGKKAAERQGLHAYRERLVDRKKAVRKEMADAQAAREAVLLGEESGQDHDDEFRWTAHGRKVQKAKATLEGKEYNKAQEGKIRGISAKIAQLDARLKAISSGGGVAGTMEKLDIIGGNARRIKAERAQKEKELYATIEAGGSVEEVAGLEKELRGLGTEWEAAADAVAGYVGEFRKIAPLEAAKHEKKIDDLLVFLGKLEDKSAEVAATRATNVAASQKWQTEQLAGIGAEDKQRIREANEKAWDKRTREMMEQDPEAARARISAEITKTSNEVNDAYKNRVQAINNATAKESEGGEIVTDAEKDLVDTLRETQEYELGRLGELRPMLAGAREGTQEAAEKFEVRGGFGAAAANRQGLGTSGDEKRDKLLTDIKKSTDKVTDAVKDSGFVFG